MTSRLKQLLVSEPMFFPIIGSVVDKIQQGLIFTDNDSDLKMFFVMHKFGFCQSSQNVTCAFLKEVVAKLHESNVPKLRWYNPPGIAETVFDNISVSERVQLQYKGNSFEADNTGVRIESINPENAGDLEIFDVDIFHRFWNSKNDVLEHCIGNILYVDDAPASLVYSAGFSNRLAEIDIVTQEAYRGRGLATTNTKRFVNHCLERDLIPNWDCYCNNLPSYKLAKKLNFKENRKYSFWNISI